MIANAGGTRSPPPPFLLALPRLRAGWGGRVSRPWDALAACGFPFLSHGAGDGTWEGLGKPRAGELPLVVRASAGVGAPNPAGSPREGGRLGVVEEKKSR